VEVDDARGCWSGFDLRHQFAGTQSMLGNLSRSVNAPNSALTSLFYLAGR